MPTICQQPVALEMLLTEEASLIQASDYLKDFSVIWFIPLLKLLRASRGSLCHPKLKME
jgi:hypothetical protein